MRGSRTGQEAPERRNLPPPEAIRLIDDHPNRFHWPKRLAKLLGRIPDSAVAKRAGFSLSTVQAERTRRGIRALTNPGSALWTRAMIRLLGAALDRQVGQRLGLSTHVVWTKRQSLGIAPYGQGVSGLKWTKRGLRLLGKLSDSEAARRLGISRGTVWLKRRAVGIPGHGRKSVKWTQAMTDLLGKMPDSEVGRRLGISKATVAAKRQNLGIGGHWKWRPLARGPELRKLLRTLTPRELWQLFSISPATVSRLRQEMDVKAPPPAHPRICWTAAMVRRLGEATDAEVARELGIHQWAVQSKRRRLGIGGFSLKGSPVRWSARGLGLLGRLPKAEVARELGISLSTVKRKRRELGIATKVIPIKWTPKMTALLGKASDREVAEGLGISEKAIFKERKRLGIAPQLRSGRRPKRPGKLTPYEPYLLEQIGARPWARATTLYEEIREKGYVGHYEGVKRFARGRRSQERAPEETPA